MEGLVDEVAEKAELIIEACASVQIKIIVVSSLRSLEEQAKLYRQSRTTREINEKISKFRDRGYWFLADAIERVGSCNGDHVTNAAPGESWHNYGLAFDAVPIVNGKPAWRYLHAQEQWEVYGEAVRQSGMTWGGDWRRFKDYPHAQLHAKGNPLKSDADSRLPEDPQRVKEMLQKANVLPKD